MRISTRCALAFLFTFHLQPAFAELQIHPTNPRYFVDETGKTVRLGGHQIFVDLQDNSFNKSTIYAYATTLDWPWYLDFATERGINFIRNWIIWSYGSGSMADDINAIASPMMYARTGPGLAADGGLKFDLNVFDDTFFQRLRQRLLDARQRGIYVSIMLFEVYGFMFGASPGGQTLWDGNVFNGQNNVNGIDLDTDSDGRGLEFFYADDPAILALQQAFVRKVIDTVNDLDNVIYEIANEVYAPDWQYAMVDYIKAYQAGKPKQHPVFLSGGGVNDWAGYTILSLEELAGSNADTFAAWEAWADFTDPPIYNQGKPVIWDNDHIWITGWDHRSTPWKAFTRGYHYVLYDKPFEQPERENEEWERMRYSVGATNRYAATVPDLAAFEPSTTVCSTTYCLADPGAAYLVYQPLVDTAFTLDVAAGTYELEWFKPRTYQIDATGYLNSSGAVESFQAPFSSDAVLFLRAVPPPLVFGVTAIPDTARADGQLFYKMTLSNQGTWPITNLVMNGLTPNLSQVAETDLTEGGDCVPSSVCNAGDSIQWLLGTLDPGETRTVFMAPTLLGTLDGVTNGTLIQTSLTVSYDGGSAALVRDVVVDNDAPLVTLDVDGDGLNNALEQQLGTNQLLADTDGEGLSDYYELDYDGEPGVYVVGQDLNPLVTDTDGDGFTDNADPAPLDFNHADGDLAPQGAPDGQVNAGDLVVLHQIVLGLRTPSFDELLHGDLSPPGAPDGIIDLADLLRAQQIVLQP